jgi:hypothetical protein
VVTRGFYSQEECDLFKEPYKGKRKLTFYMGRAIKKHPSSLTNGRLNRYVDRPSYKGLLWFPMSASMNSFASTNPMEVPLWKPTCHKLKHRKRPLTGKRISIKDKIFIEFRPAVVDKKERCGDWEIDTIIGKDGKGPILTLRERKTSFLLMGELVSGKQALPLSKVAVRLLYPYKETVPTIPSENGTEFAEPECISKKLGSGLLFCSSVCFP